MVDVCAQRPATVVYDVQAIALRQPALERAVVDRQPRAGGPVACAEVGQWAGRVDSAALVGDLLAMPTRVHLRVEVRQPIPASRGGDRSASRGVEAEEVDPGLLAVPHVGTDVQLLKARQP